MSFRSSFPVALLLAILSSSFTSQAEPEAEPGAEWILSSQDYQEHRQRMMKEYGLKSFNPIATCRTSSLEVDGAPVATDEISPSIFSVGKREEGRTWVASLHCKGCVSDVFGTKIFSERDARQRTPFRVNPDWIWIDRTQVDTLNEGKRTTVDFNVKTGKLSLRIRKGGCWIPLILTDDTKGCLMPKWSRWIEAEFECTKLGLPFREW